MSEPYIGEIRMFAFGTRGAPLGWQACDGSLLPISENDALFALIGTTYGAIAAGLGKPGASRAVGLANGHNRLSIVVPCHRVIGADGSLTGFGGGLPTKQFLLELEGALPPSRDLFA